jgi:hypothetical protein
MGIRRFFACVVAGLLPLTIAFEAGADDAADQETFETVQVADPFLDLRTGPGRGYPIFHIAERGESISILRRRTDWFQVRTVTGKTGWVTRDQMERTLTDAGVQKTFRDVLYEDYVARRFEASFFVGAVTGDGIADRDILLGMSGGYRLNENLTAELALSNISDSFFTARLIYVGIVSVPYPNWSVTPTFSLGIGKATITPKATLINVPEVDTEMATAGIGARKYFSRRFFLRADYKVHRLFIDDVDRTDQFNEISAGIGFFF